MKKFILLLILFVFPLGVNAGRGCCSRHGGVCGCSSDGRTICCDNTLSPSCRCTPPRVNGCTDSNAENYNIKANKDDGSCVYKKEEIFTEEKNDIVIKEENIKNDEDTINDKKRVIKTDNDTGTELFYVTTFLGLCGYGVKKLVSKK